MLSAIKILAMLVGFGMMLAGGYVVFEGGVSRTPPLHLNWACFALGVGLMAAGALLAWFGRPSRASVQ